MKVLWFISILAFTVAQPTCEPQDLSQLWPDLTNPRYFFQCVSVGKAFRMPCSSDTWFSLYDQTCVDQSVWRAPPGNIPINQPATEFDHHHHPTTAEWKTSAASLTEQHKPEYIIPPVTSTEPKFEYVPNDHTYDGPPTPKESNYPMPPTPPPTAPTLRPTPDPNPQPPKPPIALVPPTAGVDDVFVPKTTKKDLPAPPAVVVTTKKPAKPVPTKGPKIIPTRKQAGKVQATKKNKPKVPTKGPKI